MSLNTANEEQANFWNGPGGDHWAQHERVYNESVSNYSTDFFAAAQIHPTDNVLDIGCGNGQTTREAARLASGGVVLGVDLSAAMVDRARSRTREEGLTNVTYTQADAQIFGFNRGEFDVAISRTGAMFFSKPITAFTNIASSLKGRGRLVLLAWQPFDQNEWLYELHRTLAMGRDLARPAVSVPGPMGLADPDFSRRVLSAAGFDDIAITSLERPFTFGVNCETAYAFVSSLGFTRGALESLAAAEREAASSQLRQLIDDHDRGDGVWFGSAAWLITARIT